MSMRMLGNCSVLMLIDLIYSQDLDVLMPGPMIIYSLVLRRNFLMDFPAMLWTFVVFPTSMLICEHYVDCIHVLQTSFKGLQPDFGHFIYLTCNYLRIIACWVPNFRTELNSVAY